MPHQSSSVSGPPVMVAKMSHGTVHEHDIESLLETIYCSTSSQASLDAAYALTDVIIRSDALLWLSKGEVLEEIKRAAVDKKNAFRREGSMFLLGALFERAPPVQPVSEVIFMLQHPDLVPLAFDALSDKVTAVKEGAAYALEVLYKSLYPLSLTSALLPILVKYLSKKTGKWQGAVGAFELLGKMADKVKSWTGSVDEENAMGVLRVAMGKRLDALIPVVESGMHDLKPEVARSATRTMGALTNLLQNDDVTPRIPLLLKAMEDPSTESLQKAIHALSQTTFVAVVTSPVLALLTPLLERSLNTPSTSQEVLRQTVVVVENLTKLVHDPNEARTFLPRLQPGVRGVKDRASLPEVRELATRALEVIDRAIGDQKSISGTAMLYTCPDEVLRVLNEQMCLHRASITPELSVLWNFAKTHICDMVTEVVNQGKFDQLSLCIIPYSKFAMGSSIAAGVEQALKDHFIREYSCKHGLPIEDEDGEVEIVNADFSLGYGGMLLLSHTKLRLLKGHRYGLCGRNGAGKSTLLRSIADNKLEGFPPPEEVRTCFVEHNQGEDAELSILEYVAKDPLLASEGMERISAVLEEVGFDAGANGRQSQRVESLSGGWKMKLALAKAMLMRADVLLLDEPTNHLDVANVKWLESYLKSHSEITSLIISHDSGFLDEVCTDIYHFEPGKKLACYHGNLAKFVKAKPEARSYYTLSSSNVQFKFPPPGILTGVKSLTRSILRMSECTFTYPNASKASLINVSCQLSLSSRVAIIGPNGAGKSTLIKVLTGEAVPQSGNVEKHPNLRVGYIKQHALEHVEMHMEKTPNQYLQWRYEHGDDREVFMKQTRILSAEEKAQMKKVIELAPGVGGQIEALMGRQKYKKTFQYNVKWVGKLPKENTMVTKETLEQFGFNKLVQEFDDHEASREGLGYRLLEPKAIAKHFGDIGLDPEIANHNQISGLSGGQKVKVVLAGAMWNNPHLLVLDEPTNFLDRDSLGGLAVAIRDYRGGVVMISHNEEFVGALCPEQWHVKDGHLEHKGHLAVSVDRFDDSSRGGTPTPLSSGAVSTAVSASTSAVNSDAEGNENMKFKSKKKKKLTRAQLKEREVRRRLRHIDWLNSPKGTPHPPDTDDE